MVEVTRAANTFGQAHYATIKAGHDGIARIVDDARAEGELPDGAPSDLTAMAFYGTLEQILTAWILGGRPTDDGDYERAKAFVVDTLCAGLDAASAPTG